MKVSSDIASLKPYVPGKSIQETMREYNLDSVVKLASNENPLGLSSMALKAIIEALPELHRYPDASFAELKQAMSEYYEVEPKYMSFGNGSNELIDLLIRVFCEPGDCILTSEKAFIAYKICAKAASVKTFELPMGEDLKFPLQSLVEFLKNPNNPKPKLLFIANPNNPTGTYIGHKELKSFLDEVSNIPDLLVVLDEAYCEFVREDEAVDGAKLFKEYKNLVLLRTLSKVFGLAGLRVGTLIAQPEVVDYINRVRNPFNVNSLAQVAAPAAVKDKSYIQKAQEVNWKGLDYFYKELERLGLPYWKSQANFVLFDTQRDVMACNEALLTKGVIMRPLLGYGLKTHLRLSVGLMKENQVAIKALEEVLKEQKPLENK